MANGENVSVPVAELALSAQRQADQARKIAKLEEALGRALEQRDALVRLVEEFRRAAGAENAPDPVGVVEDLRRRAEGKR